MEKNKEEGKQKELDREESQDKQIQETGQVVLDGNSRKHKVELLTVIGEIEGHESAPSHSKTTKYEHVLPKLALIEDDEEIEGLLILLNTVGGDVEAGLAIAEMIASLSIPTVSLVLRGLFFYRAKCYHGHPSGAPERNVHRCGADVPQYGKDPGSHHGLCIETFRDYQRTDGGTDAGYFSAGKRRGDQAGRRTGSEGRGD